MQNLFKKLNRVFAPVILIQTITLWISDITSLLFAFKLGIITDSITNQHFISANSLFEFLLLLVITLLLLPLLTYWGNKQFFIKSIQEDSIIFENILNQSPAIIINHEAGTLSSKIIDNSREIRWAIVDRIAYGSEFILLSLASIYIACKTNLILTILILLFAIARIIFLNHSAQIVSKKKMTFLNIQQMYTDNVLNASKCHDFISFNNYATSISEKLTKQSNDLVDNEYKQLQITEQKIDYISNVIDITYYIAILLCGSILERKGIVGIGTVITIVFVYQFFSKEFENISKFYKAKTLLKELLHDMSTYIGDIDNKNSTNKPFYELTYDSFIFDVSKEKRLSYNSNCIKSGSKCAIIGENGAGKTTLLKLLSGVKEEKSMNYKINNSNDIRNHLKNHSILLDSDSFLACQSVNEYLISTGAQTTKINELCTIFEIKNLLNRKGNELSGGERKRIDFVHMLLENRELVFIDEPEVFLDKKWKKIIINSIKESSKTIIYTTHDKEFIKMADMQICI